MRLPNGINVNIEEQPWNGKALCITSKCKVLVYWKAKLLVVDQNSNSIEKEIILPIGVWKRWISKIRLFERLLHIEARWAIEIDEKSVLIQLSDGIYLCNYVTGKCSKEPVPVRGKTLSACFMPSEGPAKYSVIIGDYGQNKTEKEVSIYGRTIEGRWEKIFSFPKGKVKHIHSCIIDENKKGMYILTGDKDRESGIWHISNAFTQLECIFGGEQKYRACQMFTLGKSIIYLSDSPDESNYTYIIENGRVIKKDIITGTCIYGQKVGKFGIVSTVCEPSSSAKNRLEYWLTNKPGKGIDGREVVIALVDAEGKFYKIMSFMHDGLPLRLFQYGTATFSNCKNGIVYFTTICVKKKDMHTYKISFAEEM